MNGANLITLNGTNGFVITGEARTFMPTFVSGFVARAGDFNGDGYNDIIAGRYLIYGSSAGFGPSLLVSSLNGANGLHLPPGSVGSFVLARSVGDVNGDGIEDLSFGDALADLNGINSGAAYIVFGSTDGFSSEFEFSDLDGSNGFAIEGSAENDLVGRWVAAAGDINGDGYDDLIIGGQFGIGVPGKAYVVFGSSSGFSSSVQISSLNGANGFAINGIDNGDEAGRSVSSAGDVNGDGIDDFVIGAPRADPHGSNSGEAYIVFGSSLGFAPSLSLSALNGANGFLIRGEDTEDRAGYSVSSAGDINGDGIDDVIIGAPFVSAGARGKSYIVFGKASGFSAVLELSALNGVNGFAIDGGGAAVVGRNAGRLGISTSAAGDVNGDGYDDILIGAPSSAIWNGSVRLFGTGASSPQISAPPTSCSASHQASAPPLTCRRLTARTASLSMARKRKIGWETMSPARVTLMATESTI